MTGEDARHGGQHARLIGHPEAQEVPGLQCAHRGDLTVGVERLARPDHAPCPIAGHRHQVADHCACSWGATSAGADEHQPSGSGRLNEDGVVGAAHSGQRMAVGHHGRVHPDADASVLKQVGHGEQLDHAIQVFGRADVVGNDMGDALAVHRVAAHLGVEGDAGQQSCLGGGVITLDVGGRVGLCVAQVLGLNQRGLVVESLGGHLVEDVVGGAVHDAHHDLDGVADQGFTQGPDDRDRARDCGLVVEVDARALGRGEDGLTLAGQQRLVGGHDRSAMLESRPDQPAGIGHPTDQFDHDVDVVTRDQGVRICGQQRPQHLGARSIKVANRDTHQFEWPADARGQVVPLFEDQTGHLRAHDPAAQQGHLERFIHRLRHFHPHSPTSSASKSSSVSRRSKVVSCPSYTATTGGRGVWL